MSQMMVSLKSGEMHGHMCFIASIARSCVTPGKKPWMSRIEEGQPARCKESRESGEFCYALRSPQNWALSCGR